MRIVQGDDIEVKVTLKTDSVATDISTATSVTLAITQNGTAILTETCSSGFTGNKFDADWSNGVIVAPFTNTETATLIANSTYNIEVEIVLGGSVESWIPADFLPKTVTVVGSAL